MTSNSRVFFFSCLYDSLNFLDKKCQKETVLTIEGTTNPAHADISINYPIWNKIQLGEEDLYSQISP